MRFEDKAIKDYHGHPRFYEILKEIAELHDRKNHDYSKQDDPLSNLRACTQLGLTPFMGVMVRLQDKWARLVNFVKKGQLKVKDESVKDTLMDNAVYSILAIILLEEDEEVGVVEEGMSDEDRKKFNNTIQEIQHG